MKYADLHVHTLESDGTLSSEHLVRQSLAAGLSCVAITDHDTVNAIPQAVKAAHGTALEVIPGIELTSQYEGREVHILGYFLDCGNSALTGKLKLVQMNRLERVYKIVDNLKKEGLELCPQDVLDISGKSTVGRMHIARALVKKGYVKTTGEAFRRYIGDNSPAYVAGFKLAPSEAAGLIRGAGGVAVLAHPYILRNDDLIAELAACGVQGLEVYYPEHSQSMVNFYLGLAAKLKLLVTGGSDFHGSVKPEIKLGMIKIPVELVDKLRQARE
ncbi:MAG: PHP domain-containing protein [Candidatus Omnitrophica bacterium]|nr:PHP domain-containing protein [Candidatus Omnitrophota bacterium]MDD5042069.1 PHP domain-containing protein [Candidatus Omnitrophota bacterium]MDD5500261.1 PHP domain-containing protein [Candidatus Omnitrophota bacterium]